MPPKKKKNADVLVSSLSKEEREKLAAEGAEKQARLHNESERMASAARKPAEETATELLIRHPLERNDADSAHLTETRGRLRSMLDAECPLEDEQLALLDALDRDAEHAVRAWLFHTATLTPVEDRSKETARLLEQGRKELRLFVDGMVSADLDAQAQKDLDIKAELLGTLDEDAERAAPRRGKRAVADDDAGADA